MWQARSTSAADAAESVDPVCLFLRRGAQAAFPWHVCAVWFAGIPRCRQGTMPGPALDSFGTHLAVLKGTLGGEEGRRMGLGPGGSICSRRTAVP